MLAAVSAPVPSYEPELIERFAARLVVRAHRFKRGASITGALLGTAAGAVPLLRLELWPFPTRFALAPVLVGLLVGGLLGFAVGSMRAEMHKLHAQIVLCQLHAQRATLAIWKVLREREHELLAAEATRAEALVEPPVEPAVAEPIAEPPVERPLEPPLTAPLLRLPVSSHAAG
jgi:hypothetical protein